MIFIESFKVRELKEGSSNSILGIWSNIFQPFLI